MSSQNQQRQAGGMPLLGPGSTTAAISSREYTQTFKIMHASDPGSRVGGGSVMDTAKAANL